jgi:NAD(P)-dependent dehydrogenase (short-subunit alcohol dehydrogenase family)
MKQKTRIDSSSVFVVSGGAKGITAQCVLKMAQQFPCRWILLGRSQHLTEEPVWGKNCFDEAELKRRIMQDFFIRKEKPTPVKVQKVFNKISSSREIGKTLTSLKALGRQVEYLSVDIADTSSLKTELAAAVARMGKISGIIHGAGNIADKWIENKTEQDFDNVYAAKVKGLENLLSCTPASQLDYLILFSSVAGFFGSAGQSDYALANEILNKSAHHLKQKYPDCHTVAIDWGPWDSGMVTPELKKAFAQRNIEVIPLEVGTQMLVEEMRNENQETAQVLIGSPFTSEPEELEDELRSYRIRRHLSLEANPFLKDHAIGGNPVLPATCAVAWTIDICEQLYPGYKFISLEGFRVLKGIVFDGTQADDFVADVREIAKDNDRDGEIEFEVRIWSENNRGKIRFHYTSQVKLRRIPPRSLQYDLYETKSAQTYDGLSFYQKKALFHGSLLQGIDRILEFNAERLVMKCLLPEITDKQQGQFQVRTFNPYLADVLLQGVLVWLDLFEKKGALPLEIQQITQFKSIPFDRSILAAIEVKLKTETKLTVNVTAYDEDGQIYLCLSSVTFTISKQLQHLFAQSIV